MYLDQVLSWASLCAPSCRRAEIVPERSFVCKKATPDRCYSSRDETASGRVERCRDQSAAYYLIA